MMDCNQVLELAPLYLSGELERERAGAVDAHLRSCPSCLRELETQAELDARMRQAIRAESIDAAGIERWFRARVAAEPRSKVTPISTRSSRRWWLLAAGGIAALLLVAGVYRGLLSPHVAPVYADAVRDHQREVVAQEPRPWFSTPSAIGALAEREGIAPGAPLVLSSGPFRIERARLCFLDGRIFLHVVYIDGSREFSVYFRARRNESLPGSPREVDNGRKLYTSSLGAEQVASLQTNDLTVMVVADRSSGDAVKAARLAAAVL